MSGLPWFRFFTDTLDDDEAIEMGAPVFKVWVLCLCIATRHDGVIPNVERLARRLGTTAERLKPSIEALVGMGRLIADDDGTYRPDDYERRVLPGKSNTTRAREYRERLVETAGSATGYKAHRTFVYQRDGQACVYCGSTESLCLDHLVSPMFGGDNEPDNLVTACKRCNSGKSGRWFEDTGYVWHRKASARQYAAVKRRLGIDEALTSKKRESKRESKKSASSSSHALELDKEKELDTEKEGSKAVAAATRKRDALWDAVVQACGIDPMAKMTESEGSRTAKAVGQIRRAGGTPEQVAERALRYQAKYAGASLTPLALSGHWGEMATEPQVYTNGTSKSSERAARINGAFADDVAMIRGIEQRKGAAGDAGNIRAGDAVPRPRLQAGNTERDEGRVVDSVARDER